MSEMTFELIEITSGFIAGGIFGCLPIDPTEFLIGASWVISWEI